MVRSWRRKSASRIRMMPTPNGLPPPSLVVVLEQDELAVLHGQLVRREPGGVDRPGDARRTVGMLEGLPEILEVDRQGAVDRRPVGPSAEPARPEPPGHLRREVASHPLGEAEPRGGRSLVLDSHWLLASFMATLRARTLSGLSARCAASTGVRARGSSPTRALCEGPR